LFPSSSHTLRVILFFSLLLLRFQLQAAQQDSVSIALQKAIGIMYSNPSAAEQQLRQVMDLSEVRSEFLTYCEAAKQLAVLLMNGGKIAQSREVLLTAMGKAEQANLLKYRADYKYLIGNSYHMQGNFSAAVGAYLEGLRYYETNQQELGQLNTYTSLADIYNRQNNFSKALEYGLKAIKLYEKKNDRFRLLSSYEQIGSLYARQRNFAKAEEAYTKALKLYKELGNKAGVAATLVNMGSLSLQLGQLAAATQRYANAAAIANELKIIPLQARSLLGLANTHARLKDYESAGAEYKKVLSLAKDAGLKLEQDEAYEGLAELYRSLNDKQTSKAYKSLSSEMKDSLFNDSILKLTSDLQLQFDYEKKQAQIEILNKEDEIKEMELNQTKQAKNFFMALSLLLVLLIFIFVFFISQNRKINKQLKRGLFELEVKNKEINEQKEQLTQLNQVKDRFFSIISHDLRNNLTTMKLYFDLVSNPQYDASSQHEFGKEVAASVQNTIDLLENLLVWASGQLKGVKVLPSKVNLNALAQENIAMLASMALQKNISLHNETEEEAYLLADPNMVNLILRNLLSNALKFTKEGGEVTIISEELEAFHQITVIDNGVGIAKDKLATLFTAHINVSTQGTGNEKGTGLGLMLCKEFTEKNGGSIWVESEEGKGSSFSLTFPKYI